jgi:23S rRNA (cytidine1920-2'-O)/16S rRNA (cytidine1409-2'-O)-methyltransferase
LRRRLDLELVRRGLARSRSEAQALIARQEVTVSGRPATKPGTLVGPGEAVAVQGPGPRYASRGGDKLSAALDRFAIDVAGRRCLDVGASTGGFTDVLLLAGAAHVVAVDVGYGQLDWRLRNDPRVTVMERINARRLRRGDLPYAPEMITADLSFISLTKVVPALTALAAPKAHLVLLVKPQFEVGREEVGRGGVVRDPVAWGGSIEAVAEACETAGAGSQAVMASPVRGPAGNVEFLLHARAGRPGRTLDVRGAIAEGVSIREAS